jgi:hypothetical protein
VAGISGVSHSALLPIIHPSTYLPTSSLPPCLPPFLPSFLFDIRSHYVALAGL